MTDNKTREHQSPEAIERDVRRTQDDIGETVDKLEQKLTPREISKSVLGNDGDEVAREALEVTRQNPIPVALIAVGLIWLLATSRSPAIRRFTDRIIGKRPDQASASIPVRPRSVEPAPAGPPPAIGDDFDRRPAPGGRF